MELESLTKHKNLSYRVPDSFFKAVNFTPVLQFVHNQSISKISEFDSEIKINNSHHKKYVFHYFIYYTCEVLKKYNRTKNLIIVKNSCISKSFFMMIKSILNFYFFLFRPGLSYFLPKSYTVWAVIGKIFDFLNVRE